VCYQLVVVSALTLSEVRSMLPAGVRADALPPTALAGFRASFRPAQTAAHLRVGRCACRLLPARFPTGQPDESHLRTRYRQLGAARDHVIASLDRHRAGTWDGGIVLPDALATFVAEHARNGGPALFVLAFGVREEIPEAPSSVVERTLAETRGGDAWLAEGASVRVTR
jgi:hypothetical protein